MPETYYDKIAEFILNNIKKSPRFTIDKIIELQKLLQKEENLEDYIETKKINLRAANEILETASDLIENGSTREIYFPNNYKFQDYYFYLCAIRLILVDLERIKIKKEYSEENDKTIKNRIMNLYFANNAELEKYSSVLTDPLFEFSPKERYASIAAYDTLLNVVELLGDEKLNTMYKFKLCNILANPYRNLKNQSRETKQICPTLFYLEQIGCEEKDLEEILKASEAIDNINRLKLGLEINRSTIEKIDIAQQELKRSIKLT